MKFIRYKFKEEINYGVLLGENVINFKDINFQNKYINILEFISEYNEKDIDLIKEYDGKYLNYNEVILLSPFEKTVHDIICVGLNYQKHIIESKSIMNMENLATDAVYFSKRAEIISGPNTDIFLDVNVDDSMDYENELAVIIGKKCKNVPKENALDYIFGFTIINDFSSRNLQKRHGQWFKGKSLDGYVSIGPVISHKDDFTYPLEINLSTKVNGEIRQNSNTKYMIRDIETLIHELSQGMTLIPGDIIATGTPEGVGIGFNPKRFLQTGDTIECEIEKIGILKNKIK